MARLVIGMVAAVCAGGAILFSSVAPPAAAAFPPAGTDVLRAAGAITVESRLGTETITVIGDVTIQRGTPYLDGGVQVIDTEIVAMSLAGQSLTGPIAVSENPALTSSGQIRSLLPSPADYPATSTFDVYVVVQAPGSPGGPVQLHNPQPIKASAQSDVTAWPPINLPYAMAPLRNVDNDGDTLIDEDTSDEDGDHFFDEDPIDGFNNDTDGLVDEDPPISQCTLALCDADGDTLIDEDPSCLPLMPTMPIGACLVSVSLTLLVDSDGDGCTDAQEESTNVGRGGRRNKLSPWDVYDVDGDRVVNISGDILAVAQAFGGSTGPYYSTAKDRTAPPSASQEPDPSLREPWDRGPPDGSISIGADILGVAGQFGLSCVDPRPG